MHKAGSGSARSVTGRTRDRERRRQRWPWWRALPSTAVRVVMKEEAKITSLGDAWSLRLVAEFVWWML